MANDLLLASVILWLAGGALALAWPAALVSRLLIGIGCVAGLAAALFAMPLGTATALLPLGINGQGTAFSLSGAGCWLVFFGLCAAALAAFSGSPGERGGRGWCFGFALSLIGALGVFGVQDGISFLVAWELMSLGGALMILSERMGSETGRSVLFMLALLEAGTIALLAAVLLLGNAAHSTSFGDFPAAAAVMSGGERLVIGLLLLFGFGAKLGLLPFYEWFPGAYGSASGATGALLSGIVLNAAYFGLARGLTVWLPVHGGAGFPALGAIVIALAVVSSILAALYAFQQENWRDLLSLSSAENACIAIALLGASLIFARDSLADLAALAFLVALLHLAGHSLGKGALFLAADDVKRATGDYAIRHAALLRALPFTFGIGALFATMSLAAMPPQAGFVSEWFLFQTIFQGFHLSGLGGRLVMALAGAGLAITAAVALATFVKVMGIGLLGRRAREPRKHRRVYGLGVFILGLGVLALAVGMPWWLSSLSHAVPAGMAADAAARMRESWVLVPLTSKFAFISPSKLILALPALALVPIAILLATRRGARRHVPVWYGGREQDPSRASTTALSFSNALRTYYSFVYRPTATTTRELSAGSNGHSYFVRRLIFEHDVAPVFGPTLFGPLTRFALWISDALRRLQSGHLNFYLAVIGLLLVAILAVALL